MEGLATGHQIGSFGGWAGLEHVDGCHCAASTAAGHYTPGDQQIVFRQRHSGSPGMAGGAAPGRGGRHGGEDRRSGSIKAEQPQGQTGSEENKSHTTHTRNIQTKPNHKYKKTTNEMEWSQTRQATYKMTKPSTHTNTQRGGLRNISQTPPKYPSKSHVRIWWGGLRQQHDVPTSHPHAHGSGRTVAGG